MKRIATVLLAGLILLSSASCNGSDRPGRDTGTDPATDTDEETAARDTRSETDSDTETVPDTEALPLTETETETDPPAPAIQNIRPVYPEVGARVRLQNERVWDFCDGYALKATNRLASFSGRDDYYPESLTLSFTCAYAADYYRVSISRHADMAEAETYLTGTPELTLDRLFTGMDYYWQVDAVASDKTYRSAVYTFTTEAGPRTVRVEGVSNTRDAGGMVVADGRRIKQGMVYRGGQVSNGITPAGRDFLVHELGIRTDLDLRTPGIETGSVTVSPLGADIRYFNYDGCYYIIGDHGIDIRKNQAIMARELRVFADPDNYPVYIHCSLGRDRTGTLVMLLQGLLGAEKTDMALDFELSCLSAYGSLGNPSEDYFPANFAGMYDYIDTTFEGNTFSEKVEKYMRLIGLSAEEIGAIRNILLEEVN